MDVALDIIDCYRRGGKLHITSVHKILKGIYWLYKKLPNVRHVNVPAAAKPPPLSPRSRGARHASHGPSPGGQGLQHDADERPVEEGGEKEEGQDEDVPSLVVRGIPASLLSLSRSFFSATQATAAQGSPFMTVILPPFTLLCPPRYAGTCTGSSSTCSTSWT